MRPPNQARPSRTGDESAIGSGNSRRSTPKSRKMGLLPEPNGVSSIRSIATTSPGLAPRTTIGPAIGAKGCPSQAAVNTALISSTSSKAPRTSTVNSSPESTAIVGGVCVLTENRYSVRFVLLVPLLCVADAGGIAAPRLEISQPWILHRDPPTSTHSLRVELWVKTLIMETNPLSIGDNLA